MSPEGTSEGRGGVTPEFARKAAFVIFLAAFAVLLLGVFVVAVEIFFLVFGGILLAAFLRALSDPIAHHSPLSPGWALTLLLVLLFGASVGASILFGPAAAEQMDQLMAQVPVTLELIREYFDRYDWGRQLVAALERFDPEATLARTQDLLSMGGWLLLQLLTVLFVGLFVAARPQLYTSGIVRLFPKRRRALAGDVMAMLGRTLRWFLLGRALAMTMVGLSTAAVLWLLGVPLAGLLGLLAGLLTFVPYLGPILGGVPILAVSLVESPILALWALLAYTAVQWIEGYILDPLIQQRMVELPPAITVTAQVLLGVLVGGVGIALATPLAAVVMVLVQMLWVREILDDPVAVGPRGFKRRKGKGRKKG